MNVLRCATSVSATAVNILELPLSLLPILLHFEKIGCLGNRQRITYPKSVTSVMHCVSVDVEWLLNDYQKIYTLSGYITSSAGLGQALVRSGWMKLAVFRVTHAFYHA